MDAGVVGRLTRFLTQMISETSGLALEDTLALAEQSPRLEQDRELARSIREFRELLGRFRLGNAAASGGAPSIDELFAHPVSQALYEFFRQFPIPFRDEHIHLTGSLDADFVYPRLAPLLDDPVYQQKIRQAYGPDTSIRSAGDVDRLIRLRDDDRFDRYLKILYLPKLILTSR